MGGSKLSSLCIELIFLVGVPHFPCSLLQNIFLWIGLQLVLVSLWIFPHPVPFLTYYLFFPLSGALLISSTILLLGCNQILDIYMASSMLLSSQ